jgi:hypothetical protein
MDGMMDGCLVGWMAKFDVWRVGWRGGSLDAWIEGWING